MKTQGKNTRYLFDAKEILQRKHVTEYVHMIRILKLVTKSKIKENDFLILFLINWNTRMVGTKKCLKLLFSKFPLFLIVS